jgi:hypothetical protein
MIGKMQTGCRCYGDQIFNLRHNTICPLSKGEWEVADLGQKVITLVIKEIK